MPNLKDIRRRIASVKNTQQITKAMKMVAAAKLRRAQEAIVQARPYADKQLEVLSSVALRAGRKSHPLLAEREPNKGLLLVLTSDRGLCGGFNTNINRAAEGFVTDNSGKFKEIELALVGRKGMDYFKRRTIPIHAQFAEIFSNPTYENSRTIADSIIKEYEESDLDAVYMVYNEFKSAIQQKVVVERLLPIKPMEETDSDLDFIYEPDKVVLLDELLKRYVGTQVFRGVLESLAAEHGARMTAMGAATDNAKEMIDKLTLQMNRARQALITNELMEVISGAEALKG